jgi:cardiolipin synthase
MRRARNHRKIAVIDRRVAHIGGVNIADRYVTGNGLGLWHDAQLRIVGEAVDAIVRLFDYDYMISEDVVCEVPMSYSGDGLQIIWSESRGGRAMEELLDEVVASARESLLFTTPYFMPPQSVIHRLAAAVERGVRVELIVPERCDVWLLDHVMRRHISEAVAHGIDVRICRRAFIHSKLAIVDGRRVVIGSANLDARSLYRNRELMAVTTNSGVVESAERFVEEMLERSTAPTARDTRSRIPALLCRWFESLL